MEFGCDGDKIYSYDQGHDHVNNNNNRMTRRGYLYLAAASECVLNMA